MPSRIAIVDYGMGNIHSVYKKIEKLSATPMATSNPVDILKADKIIIPGVGHFKKAMENLMQLKIHDALHEAVLVKKTPVLGICLGMQLMATRSEEGNVDGLGWMDGNVVRFEITNKQKYKVPQTGWNTIRLCRESVLLKGIDQESEFYFLHSYHLQAKEKENVLAYSNFESDFVSAVEKENIFGIQFHPEKSHEAGEQVLKHFIDI